MSSLYSPRWHRVAGLKPRLAQQIRVRRLRLRGTTWVVLADPASGRSVRLNAAAYAVAGRFDGERSVQQLWDAQLQRGADPATQDEVIDLLARLREAALVQFDRAADFDLLLPHLETVVRPKGRGSLLAWRVPLANPSALLDRLQALQPLIFSPLALLAWLLAVGHLLVLALQHGPTLWAHAMSWMATPRYALLAMLLYVPIKLVHELAHGLAVRRWGGQVREAGVTLMLLMPVPYVDASAASSFVRRRQRVAVSAAGIMAELGLAALALPLWLWLDDGRARDAAFVTLFITGVSTLLFNANPLQRLDGYYLLTDALALPNLGPRSREWWVDVLLRRLLRLPAVEPMPVARGETPWLAAYAPLAWCYGIFIASVAVLWLGQLSLALGLLCAGLLGWQMVLRPLVRLIGQLRRAAQSQTATTRRWRRLVLAGSLVLLLALALPMPQRSLVQGVAWPPDQAQLRADEEGFVDAVHAGDGQMVRAGELVLQLANPKLQADLDRQSARVAALETELFQALPNGMARRGDSAGGAARSGDARAGDADAELAAAVAELDRLTERVEALAVRAGVAGRIALPAGADLPGRFIRQGSLLGQVLTGEPPMLRLALPESQAADLRGAQREVSVRLAGSPGVAHDALLLRDSVGAVLQLPSAALSARHGGHVQTDPGDKNDLKPLQPVVLLDVQLERPIGGSAGPAPTAPWGERIGERAWVRFDAG
ncbi:MAG: PqqD family peptide modification chaperone, partial [Rhizobacter sp.]|nr:PqqD family peptide modification chaperone [Rhizobacter sp.]